MASIDLSSLLNALPISHKHSRPPSSTVHTTITSLPPELLDVIISQVASTGERSDVYHTALVCSHLSEVALMVLYRAIVVDTQECAEELANVSAIRRYRTAGLVLGMSTNGSALYWGDAVIKILRVCSEEVEILHLGVQLRGMPYDLFSRFPFPRLNQLLFASHTAPCDRRPLPRPPTFSPIPLRALEIERNLHNFREPGHTNEVLTALLPLTMLNPTASSISELHFYATDPSDFSLFDSLIPSITYLDIWMDPEMVDFWHSLVDFLGRVECMELDLRLSWATVAREDQGLMFESLSEALGTAVGKCRTIVIAPGLFAFTDEMTKILLRVFGEKVGPLEEFGIVGSTDRGFQRIPGALEVMEMLSEKGVTVWLKKFL